MGMKATACAALFWLWGLATLQPILPGKSRAQAALIGLIRVEGLGYKLQSSACYRLVLQPFHLNIASMLLYDANPNAARAMVMSM